MFLKKRWFLRQLPGNGWVCTFGMPVSITNFVSHAWTLSPKGIYILIRSTNLFTKKSAMIGFYRVIDRQMLHERGLMMVNDGK